MERAPLEAFASQAEPWPPTLDSAMEAVLHEVVKRGTVDTDEVEAVTLAALADQDLVTVFFASQTAVPTRKARVYLRWCSERN